MEEIIKISKNGVGTQLVSASDLYDFLELKKSNWSRWAETNIVKNQFAIQGEDYDTFFIVKNGNQTCEYSLTIPFAKKLAMMSRTVKGEQARDYFIECEKLVKGAIVTTNGLSRKEILTMALEAEERAEVAEQKLLEAQPKVDFYDEVTQSKDAFEFSAVAKIINRKDFGRNHLFEFLRNEGVLRGNNEPYQAYVDRGWFTVVETKFTVPNGDIRIGRKTVVYQKGIDGIIKLLDK